MSGPSVLAPRTRGTLHGIRMTYAFEAPTMPKLPACAVRKVRDMEREA